jgi:hypothetical protein
MRKLGLIQSRGLGDIIIALPIAKYFHDRGWHVVWPIDQRFLPSFAPAVDYVEFVPFEFTASVEGFLMTPLRILKSKGCERIIPLYSYLKGTRLAYADLAAGLAVATAFSDSNIQKQGRLDFLLKKSDTAFDAAPVRLFLKRRGPLTRRIDEREDRAAQRDHANQPEAPSANLIRRASPDTHGHHLETATSSSN